MSSFIKMSFTFMLDSSNFDASCDSRNSFSWKDSDWPPVSTKVLKIEFDTTDGSDELTSIIDDDLYWGVTKKLKIKMKEKI